MAPGRRGAPARPAFMIMAAVGCVIIFGTYLGAPASTSPNPAADGLDLVTTRSAGWEHLCARSSGRRGRSTTIAVRDSPSIWALDPARYGSRQPVCPYRQCAYVQTQDEATIAAADAVIVSPSHVGDYAGARATGDGARAEGGGVRAGRAAGRPLIVLASRNPRAVEAVHADPELRSAYDLTATYRMDSDVPLTMTPFSYSDRPDGSFATWQQLRRVLPPGQWSPPAIAASAVGGASGTDASTDLDAIAAAAAEAAAAADEQEPPPRPALRAAPVVWIEDHCSHADTDWRKTYAGGLAKALELHSYGSCLRNREWDAEAAAQPTDDARRLSQMRGYRFALVLEGPNPAPPGYVTHSVFEALKVGAIPVYLGPPDAAHWLPAGSFVDASLFKGPAELAEHLSGLLRGGEAAVAPFYAWKADPMTAAGAPKELAHMFFNQDVNDAWCRLCDAVADRRAELAGRKRCLFGYCAESFSRLTPQCRLPASQRQWRGQLSQDETVMDHLFKGARGGVYFEAGANNGEDFSNTWAMDKVYNWSGVCVEANPVQVPLLRKARPTCHTTPTCLASKRGETVSFLAYNSGLAGVEREVDLSRVKNQLDERSMDMDKVRVTLKCTTLTDVFASAGVDYVDFFSLDIEGSEMAALEGLDFDKVTVYAFMIEDNSNANDKLWGFLRAKGYSHVHQIGPDHIWVKEPHGYVVTDPHGAYHKLATTKPY